MSNCLLDRVDYVLFTLIPMTMENGMIISMLKKIFFITGLMVTVSGAVQAQSIGCSEATAICAGFGPENGAFVRLTTPPPIPVPGNTILNYTWTVTHENGTWVWYSNFSDRWIPMPFPGVYTIRVKIEYVRRTGTSRPYAAFWSNRLYLTALDCN